MTDFDLDPDIEELYLSGSPRYTEGIEFDSPIVTPRSPTRLPLTVTVKNEFWKDTEQDVFGKRFTVVIPKKVIGSYKHINLSLERKLFRVPMSM